ncbi:MAG: GntR family transcriptional regulator [bacterium]
METKYEHIKQQILRELYKGRWQPGNKLPALPDLAIEFKSSQWATNRALTLLIQQGILERHPKQGTYVRIKPSSEIFNRMPIVVLGWGLEGFDNPYVNGLFSSLKQHMPLRDWVFLHHRSAEEVALALQMLGSTSIVAVTQTSDDLPSLVQYARAGLQVLCLGAHIPGKLLHFIATDNAAGVYDGMRYLSQLGHHRVGYLGYFTNMFDHIERFNAFKSGRTRFNIDRSPELLAFKNNPNGHMALVNETLDKWFSSPNPPTAIFSAGCDITWALLPALEKRGIRYPQDISLLTFDDLPLVEQYSTPITAIQQRLFKMGKLASEALKRFTDARHPLIQIILPPKLIVRSSCRKIT